MPYTCENCNRTFATELKLDLHRDSCLDDRLLCRRCGERFSEAGATTDGWHYRCPSDDCDGEGVGEDIVRLSEAKVGIGTQ